MKSCAGPGWPTVIDFVTDCGDSAPAKLTLMFSSTVPPSGKLAGTETVNVSALVTSTLTFPYDRLAGRTVAPAVGVVTWTLTPVAVPSPRLVTGTETVADSPGSRNWSPSVLVVITGSSAMTSGCGVAPVCLSARSGITMPKPVSRS